MKVLDYGKSMYGGYYINYFKDGEYKGIGGKTLKECCEKLGIKKADLKGVTRYDN